MQASYSWAVTALVGLSLCIAGRVTVADALQGAGQTTVAPAAGRGAPPFPAQQRPPDDAAVVERGKLVYGISCRACHGPDLRGGDMGGPNLLRSDVMLNDVNGERLLPIVRGSRANSGMPTIELSADDTTAVAIYIHSILAAGRAQGAPPPGPAQVLNILVGDAARGQTYFNATCASCHSASGDLEGIGARVSDPSELQNLWVGGGRADRSFDPEAPPSRRDVTVTVAPVAGPTVAGRLDRIDDFTVTLILTDGTRRSFRRRDDIPKVQINDPLAAHRKLLETYTDRDIHNVTAYLVTLR